MKNTFISWPGLARLLPAKSMENIVMSPFFASPKRALPNVFPTNCISKNTTQSLVSAIYNEI